MCIRIPSKDKIPFCFNIHWLVVSLRILVICALVQTCHCAGVISALNRICPSAMISSTCLQLSTTVLCYEIQIQNFVMVLPRSGRVLLEMKHFRYFRGKRMHPCHIYVVYDLYYTTCVTRNRERLSVIQKSQIIAEIERVDKDGDIFQKS